LDSAARRSAARGVRRALVHDQKDGLTINFNGDYPGGVTVIGMNELTVHGNITFEMLVDFPFIGSESGEATATEAPAVLFPISYTVNLADKINSLQKQIIDLQNKIAALEARP